MLKGFEPFSDKLDRRLLYEVTALELFENEFKGEDSSDSDDFEQDSALYMVNPDSDDESERR